MIRPEVWCDKCGGPASPAVVMSGRQVLPGWEGKVHLCKLCVEQFHAELLESQRTRAVALSAAVAR